MSRLVISWAMSITTSILFSTVANPRMYSGVRSSPKKSGPAGLVGRHRNDVGDAVNDSTDDRFITFKMMTIV